MISAEPPAAKPTITRTGLDGYVCARASHETTGRAAQPVARYPNWRRERFMAFSLGLPRRRQVRPSCFICATNVKLHDRPVYPEGDVLPALDTEQTCRSVNGMSAFGGQ